MWLYEHRVCDNFLINTESLTLVGSQCGGCTSVVCPIISLQTQKAPTVRTLVPENSIRGMASNEDTVREERLRRRETD